MDQVEQYKIDRPRIESFADRLKYLLHDIANIRDIDVHAIEARAKSIDSFSEKINRPGKIYKDPLVDITDLCGLRVILYYQEDVGVICNAIREEFRVDENKSIDKKKELSIDRFGYISVHLICQLSEPRSNLVEWIKYADLTVEIQVRTVLQHAWASISHAIKYKSESDVPSQFSRKLSIVSGLLELSDEQFSELRTQSKKLRDEISAELKEHNLNTEINAISLDEYLSISDTANAIKSSVIKAEFHVSSGTVSNSQLLGICHELSITTLQELDGILRIFTKYAEEFFVNFSNVINLRTQAISGDIDHWCAVALIVESSSRDLSFITKNEIWGKSYLDEIKLAIEKTSKVGQA